jgi:phosphatidate cytidylyltransferase
MLKWRLLLGTLIVGALVGVCILDARADIPGEEAGLPGVFLMPVLLALTFLATHEVLGLARAAGIHPVAWPVYVGNLFLVVAQWLPELTLYGFRIAQLRERAQGRDLDYFDYPAYLHFVSFGSQSPLWALIVGVLMIFVAEMRRFKEPGGALANIAVGVFGLIYIGLMCTFVVQIRIFWGVGALAAWILSVKMGDIGAYTIGRLFGMNKMSPTISPGKTVEGALGALLFAMLGAWIGFHAIVQWAPPYAESLPGSPNGWIVFGLLMGSVGMLGDLAESLLKRDVGVKDSSAWMPGFGGVLDILDSLLLTAPIAWLCWLVGLVGSGGGS